MASSKQSVVKAWETKLGLEKEYRVEEVENKSTGEKGFNLISRNGSVTAFATTLEALEKAAGQPFVESSIDLSVAADPVEIDNSVPGKVDEPTSKEAEKLRKGVVDQAEHSGNDTTGETTTQGDVTDDAAKKPDEAKAKKEADDKKAQDDAAKNSNQNQGK